MISPSFTLSLQKIEILNIMGKYLDPRADLTFKKIFGEHKHLVISLLNAMLPLADDELVESIEYWPADKIPDRTEVEKYSIVDVCCRDNKGREFIVEMQMSWSDSFKNRVLLNASKAYVAQTRKGQDYESLQPVFALNFVNAIFQKDLSDYYHYYHLVHDKYTNEVIDGLHLIFVELPKFRPQNFSQRKMQVLWLRFLTEIDENTREAPAELLENAEVNEALEIVERAAFSEAEMRSYDKFWDNISVQVTLRNAYEREKQRFENEAQEAAALAEKIKKEMDKAVEEKDKAVEEKDKAVEEKDKAVEEKDKAVEEMDKAVEEKDKAVEEKDKAVEEKDKAVAWAKEVQAKWEEQRYNTARKLVSMNIMTLQQIADATGLTVEEIDNL